MALIAFDALIDGEPVELEAVIDGSPESLVVLRRADTVRAWLNVCPHAGRRLDWAPGKFLRSREGHLVCAAHGAAFELQDGPCRGQALRAVDVQVSEGQVVLSA